MATLVRTIFGQADASVVKAQYDRVVDAVPGRYVDAAEHLDAARAELLACTGCRRGALAADLEQQSAGTG